jgi:hypothetical protein
MSNTLGFLLSNTVYYIHATGNNTEVARFGSSNDSSHIRLYSASLSNAGYTLGTIQHSDYCDFSISGKDLSAPSLYVQGYSGRVGIRTDNPTHDLTVNGNLYISGQLVQQGTNITLSSETFYSTTIFADYIYSCNQYGNIDFSCNSIQNVKHLGVLADLTVGGAAASTTAPLQVNGPVLQVMGNMQKFEVLTGKMLVTATGGGGGPRQFGFIVSWDPGAVGASHIFEVTGSTFMTGPGIRQSHRFTALVDPTDAVLAGLPGLDNITDQSSFVSPNLGKSTLKITRYSGTSVKVFVQWTPSAAAALVEYTANACLEIFAPVDLGTLTAVPFLT